MCGHRLEGRSLTAIRDRAEEKVLCACEGLKSTAVGTRLC